MKIKTKLLLGLGALPVLVLLLAGIGWFQAIALTNMSGALQRNYETAFLAEEIHRKVKDEAIYLRNLAMMTDEASIRREIELLRAEEAAVAEDLVRLEGLAASPEQRVVVERVKRTNDRFVAYVDDVVRQVAAGNRPEAARIVADVGHGIQDEFFRVISALTYDLHTELQRSLRGAPRDFQRSLMLGSIVSLAGLLAVSAYLFRNVWQIAVRLNRMSGAMTAVADGRADLTTRIDAPSRDELDDVARSFNRMAQSLEEQTAKERNDRWLKSNVAELTTLMTGAQDAESLARAFLSKAVPLVRACHAVFYVKEAGASGGEPLFRLAASYAFKERKHPSNTFRMGEGLAGQAAYENTPILLTSVPPDYIRVRSGLGEAAPLNVYVLPIGFKGDVKAVLEIASFDSFTATEQAFLGELTRNAGIILDSVMGTIRLARLLKESQAMTEELQAQSEELQTQQEELRAANEELEGQTLALRQSEERLQAQQEELEQTNAELKEKAETLERQNREVERARDELEDKAGQLAISSKYKSEFLANMSHELRTPLNSLLILSKLLSDNNGGNLTDKQVEYASIIHSSGSDLLLLIDDMLDLAKIESGKMDVNPSEVPLANLADFAERNFRPVAEGKRLQFAVRIEEGVPQTIYNDERRMQQVLRNLLSNAFKFTHQGKVELVVGRRERPGKAPELAFAVADTGIGIARDKQEVVFEAFRQADGTTSRRYGGTGLGLSICREIAALVGGEIAVESEEGKGSVFTFFAGDYRDAMRHRGAAAFADEAAAAAEPPRPAAALDPAPAADRSVKRMLIVDDDLRQRNSLMELIGEKNVVITAVSTGVEALEQLRMNPFDCLVLDLGLADTDGFELLEAMQAGGLGEAVKVFIYTGRDLSSKEEYQLRKYAHTIIIKDSHAPQRLMDELGRFLSAAVDAAGADAPAGTERKQPTGELEGKRILLIDDDVRTVFALSSVLELNGMDVVFAEDGAEGLAMLEKGGFDLVLTDIMMPGLDGYETIRRLRRIPGFEGLPVIALTAKAMREDREKCIEAGASDYIVKPVDSDQLISLIKVWLFPQKH